MTDFKLSPLSGKAPKLARVYNKVFLRYHLRRGAYIRHITEAYQSANLKHLRAGVYWYERAQDTARCIHPNVLIAAGIIAALSPRTDWKHNVLYAERVARFAQDGQEYPPPCSTFDRLGKAWRIANLENPTAEQILAILRGPKTCCFFKNIIGDSHAVTIDVWSKRVATGGKDDSAPKPGHDYNTLEQAYQVAAQRLGVTPRDLQATVWVWARGSAE